MRERADAWVTAIGLQKVDGLTPSDFLKSVGRLRRLGPAKDGHWEVLA